MKIVFLLRHFQLTPKLIEQETIWSILKELVSFGIDAHLIAQKNYLGPSEIYRDGIKVHFLGQTEGIADESLFYQNILTFLEKNHEESPISIIHCLDFFPGSLIGPWAKKRKVRIIFDVDILGLSKLFSIFNLNSSSAYDQLKIGLKTIYLFLKTYLGKDRDLLSYADGIIVSSPEEKIFLDRYYMYPESRIFLVTKAFSSKIQTNLENPNFSVINSMNPIVEQLTIILHFSDMNLDEFETTQVIKAFEKVVIKKRNCYLVIIGNGSFFKKIEFEILNLALGNYVFMIENIADDEISKWINFSDLIIDLSPIFRKGEIYLIEAMLRKKIVIASELGYLAHIIENGVDGFLVRPGDIEGISQLILKLTTDEFPKEKIQQSAYEKASEVFNPGRSIDMLLKSYQIVLEREIR